jgi:hypothetical protein
VCSLKSNYSVPSLKKQNFSFFMEVIDLTFAYKSMVRFGLILVEV